MNNTKIEIPKNELDSPEEHEFQAWCEEALTAGLLESFTYHPKPFQLSDKVEYKKTIKLKTKTKDTMAFLLHPHEYTPDFKIQLTEQGKTYFESLGIPLLNDNIMYVDVKGSFSRFHDAKSFAINQKWVMAKYGVYIHKIIPEKWFAKTWVPASARGSPKKGKLRSKYANLKTLEDLFDIKKTKISAKI